MEALMLVQKFWTTSCWKRSFIFSLRYIARSSLWGLSVSNMVHLIPDVIQKIFVLNCIGAAEKTSILSGNPVYAKNWSRHPDVVFDSNFWEEHWTRNPLEAEAHWTRNPLETEAETKAAAEAAAKAAAVAAASAAAAEIVSGVLRDHRGPIRKLILCSPKLEKFVQVIFSDVPKKEEVVSVIRYDCAQHMNQCLFSLPRNDMEEIILYNYNDETYTISFLYLFVNLTRLDLRNCRFYQPFGGFGNLHCIRLDNIKFGSVMEGATVIYNFPNLTFFTAVDCSGFRYLKIQAPNLERCNVCATNGDGMYDSTLCLLVAFVSGHRGIQEGQKLDTKSVKEVDLVYDEGLVYLKELSFLYRPQQEESWRQTVWSRRFPN
ncbi:unnamed protein product [Camellia sinensis]